MASDYVVVMSLSANGTALADLVSRLVDSGFTVIAGHEADADQVVYAFAPDAAAVVVVCGDGTPATWWSPFGSDIGRVLLVTMGGAARVPDQLADLDAIDLSVAASLEVGFSELVRRLRALVDDSRERLVPSVALPGSNVMPLEAGEAAVSTPLYAVGELKRLVGEVRDLGFLLADDAEHTRLIRETLDEIGNSYRVVLDAIESFYSTGILGKEAVAALARIRGGVLAERIHNGRGHCKRIGARYFAEGGLRGALVEARVSLDTLTAADATFRQLTQADLDMFDALDSVGSALTLQARHLYPLVITGQTRIARRSFESALAVLAPLEDALVDALAMFQEVEQLLGFAQNSAPEGPRMEDRSINIYGSVTNAVVASTIQGSSITLQTAQLPAELRQDLDELLTAVAAMSERLSAEDAEAAAVELDQLTSEVASDQPKAGIVKKCLRSLEQFGKMAAEVGLPVVELATKIAAAF